MSGRYRCLLISGWGRALPLWKRWTTSSIGMMMKFQTVPGKIIQSCSRKSPPSSYRVNPLSPRVSQNSAVCWSQWLNGWKMDGNEVPEISHRVLGCVAWKWQHGTPGQNLQQLIKSTAIGGYTAIHQFQTQPSCKNLDWDFKCKRFWLTKLGKW